MNECITAKMMKIWISEKWCNISSIVDILVNDPRCFFAQFDIVSTKNHFSLFTTGEMQLNKSIISSVAHSCQWDRICVE